MGEGADPNAILTIDLLGSFKIINIFRVTLQNPFDPKFLKTEGY